MLQPDVHPSFERLLGASGCAIFAQCLTYRKEQRPLAALTIAKHAQIVRLSRTLVQGLSCLLKEPALLLATVSLPEASTGSIHEEYGPSA